MARLATADRPAESSPAGDTPPRRFRYPEDAWREVQAQAASDQHTASSVVRAFLDAYRAGALRLSPDGKISLSRGAGDDADAA